ncbi:hypothetical protein BDZ97DRAFT_2054155 [Flammula alnicola]|nr:hypothetical protein BDZ97DRAFT_2054155 [Flammula alnicola]
MTSTSAWAALTSLLVALFLWFRKPKASSAPLPPPPVLLLGNVRDLTAKELWLPASKWAKQYGDVVYLNLLGIGLVFVNSPEAASELLDKRGSIYSNKPSLVMPGELCGCKNMHFIANVTNYGLQHNKGLATELWALCRLCWSPYTSDFFLMRKDELESFKSILSSGGFDVIGRHCFQITQRLFDLGEEEWECGMFYADANVIRDFSRWSMYQPSL